MRIVSLLPAATEIVHALGLGDELVGRSHACDEPPGVSEVPPVTRGPAPGEAGARDPLAVRLAHATHGGVPGLRVDQAALLAVDPDLILTQDRCRGCVPAARDVERARGALGPDVAVVTLEPRSVEGVLNAISTVGAFAEAEDEAVGLLELLREDLARTENRVLERRLAGIPSPRVVVLAWLDPPYTAAQWVPEMVRRAGGWDVLGAEGVAPVEATWGRVREVDPEVLVVAPAGLDAAGAAEAFSRLALPDWFSDLTAVRNGALLATDGAGLLWRPGPRLLDAIALLADLLDPGASPGSGPRGAWLPLSLPDASARTAGPRPGLAD
jgi:iron complex transport system substrate-binding protein